MTSPSMNPSVRSSRRQFLGVSAALAAGCFVTARPAFSASRSANEKLNIAVIGPGGRGHENLMGVSSENIVAIVDADFRRAAKAFELFPNAKKFSDYRKLFDTPDFFDAVVVSTPDHTHAAPTSLAMKQGKHVYTEKPLTHSLFEARSLQETAAAAKVATQMGTQIHAGENYRRVVEIIRSGAIGPVTEVHVWVGKGWGGGELPKEFPPVPEGLDWNSWVGPAPFREFHPTYVPANWRRWWDFGNGTLGDMGCHYMDLPFWALGLKHPTKITAEGPALNLQTAPIGMTAEYEFPAVGSQPACKLKWYDGTMTPKEVRGRKVPGSGVMFVGSEGEMFADYGSYKLYPEEKFADFKPPAPTIPRSIGHHQEWIRACKTGEPTTCSFDYSGPLTETVLLGCLAYRMQKPIAWDAVNLKCPGTPEADAIINRPYREGWTL